MKLALRLALSHLLIVVLFAVITIVTFLLSTRPPLPLDNRVETLVKLVQQRPAQGEAEKRFKRLRLPLKSALWAQDSDGNWSSVSGSGTPPTLSKEQLASTWQGQDVLSFTPEDGTATYSFPVFEDGKVVQVGLLRNWGDRRALRRRAAGSWILASLVAASVCLLISWWLSRRLSKPVTALVEVTERFGPQNLELRAPVSGPAELAQLGQSFNSMADRLQATEQARRHFLSDLSHNLRTPLAAILGWTDALEDGLGSEKERQGYLHKIRRETLFVTRTVERLLELSRWEKAEPRLRLEEFPLSEPLMEVAENLEDAAARNQISLEFEGITPDLLVRADRHRLRDLLQILLENVVEHAGREVTARVRVSRGERIQVAVEDDGCGIEERFEPDGDPLRATQESGRVSLGLAIAARLARAHGGELTVQPRTRGGTRAAFTLELPGK